MLVGRCSSQLSSHKLQAKSKKVTSSERTRISYFTALAPATYVVLLKENHMQLTEAATLDRKFGEAEGSAGPQTTTGNAEYDAQTELSSRPERKRSGETCGRVAMEPLP